MWKVGSKAAWLVVLMVDWMDESLVLYWAAGLVDGLVVEMVVLWVVWKAVTRAAQMDMPMVGNLVDAMAFAMVASWAAQRVVKMDDTTAETKVDD